MACYVSESLNGHRDSIEVEKIKKKSIVNFTVFKKRKRNMYMRLM